MKQAIMSYYLSLRWVFKHDVNVSVGTIFQFLKNKDAKTLADHCCQKGSEQVDPAKKLWIISCNGKYIWKSGSCLN